ncbi:hypothetical protein PG994_002370 [Apiospora phragmitis]|uniref:NAD-dependent epimerase/dehydratase domain-containing protein n=1 Tax=Apiospora phragmitis TaxID=2905665 RepID=A0ABR1WW61_9PEZI
MTTPEVSIPKGSLVLITGATGYVAPHTIKQFLERGYRVRGAIRDLPSAAWLTEDVFKPFADSGFLELVHVLDLGAKHAFDQAIRGASAIVHIASILTFADDPSQVIAPVVNCVTSILEVALAELSVKSFVYISSIATAVNIRPGVTSAHHHVGRDSWNDWAASKVEAEKAVWAFAERNKPHYTLNVVSPATVLGKALVKRHLENPYPWIKNLYDGDEKVGALFQAIIHINVKDVALLHVAATLDPACNGARLQAWGEHCNMNDILAIRDM